MGEYVCEFELEGLKFVEFGKDGIWEEIQSLEVIALKEMKYENLQFSYIFFSFKR